MHTDATGRRRLLPLLAMAALLVNRATAQDEDFAAWLAKDQADLAAYSEAVTRQYEAYLAAQQKAFDEFVKQAGMKWGRGNVWVPQPKTWVQYANRFEERTAVDFENGKVRVQLLLPEGAAVDKAVRAQMSDAVRAVLLSGTDDPVDAVARTQRQTKRQTSMVVSSDGMETFVHIVQPGETAEGIAERFGIEIETLRKMNRLQPDAPLREGRQLVLHRRTVPTKPAPVAEVTPEPPPAPPPAPAPHKPLLDGQVVTPDGAPVTAANVQAAAAAMVAAKPPVVAPVKGDDGRARTAVSVEFPLVSQHIRVRAERYRPYVREYANRYQVDPALVFAVMHTESCFNPRARSGAPAFGLMQLVPTSGARDAYRFVHGKDAVVDGNYLYDPEKNVELGTAYLHLLDNRQLKAIRDPLSRQYCAIAAYNTGAGNVSRAFGNTTSVATAARTINTLEPPQVYAQLRARLPHQETRDYVQRVSDRIPLYTAWR
jgi:membrane-bound lytic murein transglycosylase C